MGLAKKAGKISGLTFTSRIFGLIRDQLFAGLIGAGFFADAFFIAFRIPNLLRDLFAEGALSNAFVPTFTETRIQESEDKAWELARLLFAWILLLVGSITLLGIIFAPQLVQIIAPGFSDIEGKRELTILLTRIMMPFLFFVSLASVLMGIHHSYQRFTLPALAPVLFNWVSIGSGLLIWVWGLEFRWAVIGWSIGTLLAGFSQFVIQLIPFFQKGLSLWPRFQGLLTHPRLKQIFFLMVPAIIALSGTQINILVNSILASLLEQGAPSWLNYAFRLMQLPIGVFGVAISVVALSQASSDVATNNMDQFKSNVQNSVQLSYLLTIPCAVGLWMMAAPIIRLIFERGAFSSTDTFQTALALKYYALGLPFYALVKVRAPIFFTLNAARIPMIASLVGVAWNIVFNIAVYKTMGHKGLALGTSLGVMINAVILSVSYRRKLKAAYSMGQLCTFGKIVLSAAMMGLFVLAAKDYLASQSMNPWIEVYLIPLGIIAAAAVVYAVALLLFRVKEARQVLEVLQKKITQR